MGLSSMCADLSRSAKCKLFCSVVTGGFLGILLSLLVNSSLVEISLNPFFSFYFGVLFIVVGIVIALRVRTHASAAKRIVLITLAILVLTSGILSLFFQRKWLFHLSPPAKIPLYSLLGLSISFAITFSVMDFFIFCFSYCNPDTPSLVESDRQIYLILFVSLVMGVTYGFLFGLFDVGRSPHVHSSAQLARQLGHEEIFCVPFGLVVGGIGGGLNEWLRYRQDQTAAYKYSPLFQDDDNAI